MTVIGTNERNPSLFPFHGLQESAKLLAQPTSLRLLLTVTVLRRFKGTATSLLKAYLEVSGIGLAPPRVFFQGSNIKLLPF